MASKNKALIFSAPSGSGKTTIVQKLLKEMPELEFSISACSRPKRETEADGVDYYFFTAEKFKNLIAQNAFLEWEEVYEGCFYGTLLSEVQRIWEHGKVVVFDVDVLGGLNVKQKLQNESLAIFIMPPSIEELGRRLKDRSTETPESLKKRLDRAALELSYAPKFDVSVINGDLETAFDEVKQIVKNFLNS